MMPESALNSPPKFRSPISEKIANPHQTNARSPLSERTNTLHNQISQSRKMTNMLYDKGTLTGSNRVPFAPSGISLLFYLC